MTTITSYEMFMKTIKDLSKSQGFYSRAYENLLELSEEDRTHMKEYINTNYDFTEPIDVILFMEQ